MPLFFGSIGLLLIIAGLRDRIVNGNPSLVSLLKDDFALGQTSSFTMWMFAIIFIGAIGYIPKMRNVSRLFLVLVVAVIFVKNKELQNVFSNLSSFFGGNTSAIGNSPQQNTTLQTGINAMLDTPNIPLQSNTAPQSIPLQQPEILQNLPTFPVG